MKHFFKKHITRYFHDDRGATAVEFGLIAGLMMSLVFGTMEMGRYFWISHRFQFAVEEAARFAAVRQDVSEATMEANIAELMENSSVGVNELNVTIAQTESSGISFVEISGEYRFTTFIPLPGDNQIFQITAFSRMPTRTQ